MQLTKKLLCHWDLVRFVSEAHLNGKDGTNFTLSVIDGKDIELMIFLEKDKESSNFEVRVYKSKPTDKYIPNDRDEVLRYEENDEYATFFFENFENAHIFVDMLGYVHKEYRVRPIRKVGE